MVNSKFFSAAGELCYPTATSIGRNKNDLKRREKYINITLQCFKRDTNS